YRVSIRTPRAGRDSRPYSTACWPQPFLSARPVRGVTRRRGFHCLARVVSIRTPRAGRDLFVMAMDISHDEFLSARPVRGVTTDALQQLGLFWFLSARPVRGVTAKRRNRCRREPCFYPH